MKLYTKKPIRFHDFPEIANIDRGKRGREGRVRKRPEYATHLSAPSTWLLPGTCRRNTQEQIYPGSLVNEFIILKFYLNGSLYSETSETATVPTEVPAWGHGPLLEPEARTRGRPPLLLGHSDSSPAHFQSLNTLGPTGDCTLMYFCSTRCVFQTFNFQVIPKCPVAIYKVEGGKRDGSRWWDREREKSEKQKNEGCYLSRAVTLKIWAAKQTIPSKSGDHPLSCPGFDSTEKSLSERIISKIWARTQYSSSVNSVRVHSCDGMMGGGDFFFFLALYLE